MSIEALRQRVSLLAQTIVQEVMERMHGGGAAPTGDCGCAQGYSARDQFGALPGSAGDPTLDRFGVPQGSGGDPSLDAFQTGGGQSAMDANKATPNTNKINLGQASGDFRSKLDEAARLAASWTYESKVSNVGEGEIGLGGDNLGNCVDQSEEMVTVLREAGLNAKIVSGDCDRASGGRIGHVWIRVEDPNNPGTWIDVDPAAAAIHKDPNAFFSNPLNNAYQGDVNF
jgi:hypothetical protein